jgi:flagellar M-ring protein FliF
MPEQIKKYTDPMQSRWNSLTRPQQYKFLGVVLVLLVAIIIALYFIFRTNWVTLANNRDILEIQNMQIALRERGIRYNVEDGGRRLDVPARDRQRAIMEITAQERAPVDERFRWADAFAGTGLSTTESQRRRMDTLALEGDIETMLEVVNGVAVATVSLAVPDPHRAFTPGTPATSAAVILSTTTSFSPQEGRDLALIVTRAVPGLELENVHIIDHQARTIFDGGEDVSRNHATEAAEHQIRSNNLLRFDLHRLLTTFFDSVEAVPSLRFSDSYDQLETRTILGIPDGTDMGFIIGTTERSEYRGLMGGHEPGVGWNWGGIPGYQMGGAGEQSGSRRFEDIREILTDTTVIQRQTMGGGFIPEESRVSVTASFNRDIRQVDWLAEDETRTQRDWEEFVSTQRNARMLNGEDFPQYEYFRYLIASASGVPVANVSLIVSEILNFVHTETRVWDWNTIIMLAIFALLLIMLAWFLLKTRAKAEEEAEEAESPLSIEDILVSTQLEEAKEAEIAALDEENYFRENEVKKQIEKFVNEKPEAVASLLRNWLNVEEW